MGEGTLLDQLALAADPATPRVEGLDRGAFLCDLVQEIATPSAIAQRGVGTCAPTTLAIDLAMRTTRPSTRASPWASGQSRGHGDAGGRTGAPARAGHGDGGWQGPLQRAAAHGLGAHGGGQRRARLRQLDRGGRWRLRQGPGHAQRRALGQVDGVQERAHRERALGGNGPPRRPGGRRPPRGRGPALGRGRPRGARHGHRDHRWPGVRRLHQPVGPRGAHDPRGVRVAAPQHQLRAEGAAQGPARAGPARGGAPPRAASRRPGARAAVVQLRG